MIDPISVVIVRWSKGWVAHVRYENPKYDEDISNSNKNYLYAAIERQWRKVNELSTIS